MSIDQYLRKAEEFLRRATDARDLRERGVLIDQAIYWHNLAVAARDQRPAYDARAVDDDDAQAIS